MRFRKPVFNLFLFVLPAFLYAQSGNSKPIETVAEELIRNIRSNSKENIQIQTDKLVYAVTEKIWFKVFILDSISDKLLASSGILFVDVVDQLDQPIARIFQHVAHKESGGSIKLPDSAASGIYWLRAYTKLNARSEATRMSIRPLILINSQKAGTIQRMPTVSSENSASFPSKPVARIYPEGGHLMSGEDNLVFVRLEDLNGNPFADSGMVKDAQGRMIERFVSNSSGIAKFKFNPTSRGKYNLFIKNAGHYDSISAMPRVNFYSAQVSITDQNNQSVKFKVLLEDSIARPDYTTYLLGINKDSVCFASVGKGMYEAYLPVNSFPAGISRLMLFNQQGILMSERDILLEQTSPRISIKPSKDRVSPREKVDLDIQILDADGKPVLASYALSVADKRMANPGHSFFEDTLLNNPSLETEMMLVSNGLGNNQVASNETEGSADAPSSFNPFIYDGMILNRKGKGLANYQVSMLSMGHRVLVLQDTTELNGGFEFNLPEFNDSLEVQLKIKPLIGIDQDYFIRAGQKNFPSVLTPDYMKKPWTGQWSTYQQMITKFEFDTLFAQAHGMLPLVTVSTSSKREPSKASRSNILTREQILSYGTESVANVILSAQGVHINGGFLVMRGVTAFQPSALDEPLLIMDGSQVNLNSTAGNETISPVLAYLRTLNIRQIESIRILNGAEAAEYGVRGGHGVIEITSTSEAPKEEVKPDKKYWLVGYQSPKSFPPDLNAERNGQNNQRTTLYWNGDLITDSQGSNKISFFTSDLVTDYLITLAGISSKGERIYKTVILRM